MVEDGRRKIEAYGFEGDLFMADEYSHWREELARLTEENVALRRAALAFGGLAERLNVALQEERRARQRYGPSREGAESLAERVVARRL